ncbi:MAG: ATP phosphoribosyltransferase [Spirochaetae bacterium HGW-Spirochaetae-7]|jgi:ATP phosphoribosyltransferase|nr:MAG: ATP phosphoribosyltransferase [Spirochaetae bacterium HGW-Spirochaetae-7]
MERKEGILRLALPKGRMQEGVLRLLSEAGLDMRTAERDYRPSAVVDGLDVKVLKPQNIIEMLDIGSRDLGFAGADWVAELGIDLVEVMDTGLDPVRLVAAAPTSILEDGKLPSRRLVVASEYEGLTRRWIAAQGMDAEFVRSYGATEVFPPEDADCIVDNTATGSTLRANGLTIVDEVMRSTTRLYANKHAMDDPARRERIEWFAMLCQSVLEARSRVMLEVNIDASRLESLIEILPAMKEPTVSRLMGDAGYAVKIAAPRSVLPNLIPAIRACGGTGIIITQPSQIVP